MDHSFFKNTFFLLLFVCFSCGSQTRDKKNTAAVAPVANNTKMPATKKEAIVTGAEQPLAYLSLLKNKKVGVVANQTSVLFDVPSKNRNYNGTHLVDFLLENSVNITKVFAPEHGFRGTADAGEAIKDGVDSKTGISIISLYGKNKKPSPQQLKNIDILIFDIQDVGARFYTYISTLHYVMEACAEANITVLLLDRPNPNGHYIDGPVLEMQHQSFVGMHPIPVVHAMTMGEYAQMINGQGWLPGNASCSLTVIKMKNYKHQTPYVLPIKPSPNLPNAQAINLYPSLCFFEGTFVSAGRGTSMQFQIFGAPSLPAKNYPFTFTPQANEGAKNPKFKGELCHGADLREYKKLDALHLEWLIEAYNNSPNKREFFNDFFTNLAGTKKLQKQIEAGLSIAKIRESWQQDLSAYKKMRSQYLLYP